jgi:hypothetical protein
MRLPSRRLLRGSLLPSSPASSGLHRALTPVQDSTTCDPAAAGGGLANGARVTEGGPRPPIQVVPLLPGPEPRYPHRPCPGHALSIGRQRSFTDNKGRSILPLNSRIAPYGAVLGSFPSSR